MSGSASGPPRSELPALTAALRAWLEVPGRGAAVAAAAVVLLVALGLLLPPVSLVTRLTSVGFTTLRPGSDQTVRSTNDASQLEVDRLALHRTTRVRLRAVSAREMERQAAPLPAGRELASNVLQLQIRGPRPRRVWITMRVSADEAERPFVDPYTWDGRRWHWLAPEFPAPDRVRVQVPLEVVDGRWIVITRATASATELSAAVLPPPATVPAAVAELPIVEVRAYRLTHDDGSVSGGDMVRPSRDARLLGIVDNLESGRVRSDLVSNMLIRPASRQRNREALVDLVRRDGLDGIVLDYRGIPDDLQPTYAAFVQRLAQDLHGRGAELVVTVPMPRRTADRWDAGAVPWRSLSHAADGVRLLLPTGVPIDVAALDSLLLWALRQVERGRLQLSVPVQGRDMVERSVQPISFGAALGHILDMARSDAPTRLSPGESRTVELPTLKAAEFGRDEVSGMWRFYYWDDNRRQHTVWLNDATGLLPAFELAGRYRLGRIVLDGVEAGLDPAVWALARQFLAEGTARAAPASYRLRWQLADQAGRVVQEAVQPLGSWSFAVRAPHQQGTYRLAVHLVTADGEVVALGPPAQVAVAPPPPPTAKPTALLIYLAPTPMPFTTAPSPADELTTARPPVRITQAAATATASPFAARLATAVAQLRAGPDVTAELLSELRAGDVLELIGRTPRADWLLVRVMSTGIEGWVLAELLAHEAAIEALPVMGAPGG